MHSPGLSILWSLALATVWLDAVRALEAVQDENVVAELNGEEAVLPRLKIAADATFERDWRKQNRAWLERVVAVPFAASSAGEPWQKEAVAFLGAALDGWRAGDFRRTNPEITAAGKALLKQGCKEPVIR